MASAVIIDDTLQKARVVKEINHPITNIIPVTRGVRIDEVLPFRVRFTTIGLAAANSNVPGIGLQIIGINNYIL
jgi:hypothetical protein